MGRKKAGDSSVYFKCDHCEQSFSLYSFRIAVFLYGIIFLADKKNGYVGIVCPSCMNTTLKKIKKARFEEIKQELGERIVIVYDLKPFLVVR